MKDKRKSNKKYNLGLRPGETKMGYQENMHEIRKQIDENILRAENILKAEQPAMGCSRCMALAHTKLQEAKMWVGKCLEAFGSKLPDEFRDKAEARIEFKDKAKSLIKK